MPVSKRVPNVDERERRSVGRQRERRTHKHHPGARVAGRIHKLAQQDAEEPPGLRDDEQGRESTPRIHAVPVVVDHQHQHEREGDPEGGRRRREIQTYLDSDNKKTTAAQETREKKKRRRRCASERDKKTTGFATPPLPLSPAAPPASRAPRPQTSQQLSRDRSTKLFYYYIILYLPVYFTTHSSQAS